MQTLVAPYVFAASQFDAGLAIVDSLFDGMLQLMDLQVNASKAALIEAALVSRASPGMALCLESGGYGQAQLSRAWSCGKEAAGIVGGMQDRLAELVRHPAGAGGRPRRIEEPQNATAENRLPRREPNVDGMAWRDKLYK